MAIDSKINNIAFTLVLAFFLVWIIINFNERLGFIFTLMLLIDYIVLDNFDRYRFEVDSKRIPDLFYAAIAYVSFVVISSILVSFIGQISLATSLSATTPVFEDSFLLSLIGWGIIIPIVETNLFFGSALSLLMRMLGASSSLKDIKTLISIFLISLSFMFFHLTAYAITKTSFYEVGLALVFLFSIISCILVIKTKEIAPASYFHIASNTIAVLLKHGNRLVGSLIGVPV